MTKLEPQFVQELFGAIRDAEFGPPHTYGPVDLSELHAPKIALIKHSSPICKPLQDSPNPAKLSQQFFPLEETETTLGLQYKSSGDETDHSIFESSQSPPPHIDDLHGEQQPEQSQNARKRDRLRGRWHRILNKLCKISKLLKPPISDENFNATESQREQTG